MNKKVISWLVAVVVVAVLIGVYRYYDLDQWLTLAQLKQSKDNLIQLFADNPWQTVGLFFVLYVFSVALSIPGAAVLTLAAGAIFGLWIGLLVVSFASSLGALLAFLVSRYFLRSLVQKRFGSTLAVVNEGIRRDGTVYLLTLRLVPLFPFWLINLLMGVTPMSAWRFYSVSQIGMLAGTFIYVNAGTQLVSINALEDVFSPGLILSFVLLGIFPLLANSMVNWLKSRKIYANWRKPQQFERNLVVIGAGAGGLVSAYIAAAVNAKVTLIETHKMGGDCLNYGCVPSKALIKSASLLKQITKADAYGIKNAQGDIDFAAVMARIKHVIATIEPHDSAERYSDLGVEVVHGYGEIKSPWEVEVRLDDGTKRLITTRQIVIATGAQPFIPPIDGLEEMGYLTSDTIWDLTELPKRLLVLGGGPIGCELAQSFARLGAQVSQVEMAPRVMVREDEEISNLVADALRTDGVNVLTNHQAIRVQCVAGEKQLVVKHNDQELVIAFDALLCAVGRAPRVTGYGLEHLQIPLTARNTIEVNEYLQTVYPNIYAVGDVAGPYQFTHTAAHQAWYAAVNALFGRFKKFKVDYSVIPWATFTDPEVARVGLSIREAEAQGVPYEVTRYGIDDLDRAIADGTAYGFVQVLTVPGKDKIIGVTIVGAHAGDLLAEFVLAMKHGLGLNKILGTIHIYPTMAESCKYVAGEWKKAHAPKKILAWLARFHKRQCQ